MEECLIISPFVVSFAEYLAIKGLPSFPAYLKLAVGLKSQV